MLLILCRFIADVDTFPGVDCYIRHGQCGGIWDEQSADTIVVDGQFLDPFTINFFGLVNFNVVDQLIQHPGCQLFGTGVFADNGKKHIRGNRSIVRE